MLEWYEVVCSMGVDIEIQIQVSDAIMSYHIPYMISKDPLSL